MTKMVAIDKFKELIQEEATKKEGLSSQIDDEQSQISTLETEYKQALSDDNDNKADTLQQDIEKLKRSVKRNKDKLNLITDERLSNDVLEQQADKVLNESLEGIDALNQESRQAESDFYELKSKMIGKVKEIKELDNGVEEQKAVLYVAEHLPNWVTKQDKQVIRYDDMAKKNDFRKSTVKPLLKGLSDDSIWRMR